MCLLPAGWAALWLCKVSGVHSVQGYCHPHFQSWSSVPQTYLPVLWSRPLFCLYKRIKNIKLIVLVVHTASDCFSASRWESNITWPTQQLKRGNFLHYLSLSYLLFEIESFGGALARPLTPAVREGSELALLVVAPSLPQVLGLRLAKKDDLGDWVLVGLLAVKKPQDALGGLSRGQECHHISWRLKCCQRNHWLLFITLSNANVRLVIRLYIVAQWYKIYKTYM